MTVLVIKTNASQLTDVTIRDMGIIIPALGGSETLTDVENFDSARLSLNLRFLVTDDAYGINSSTLILNDGTSDIPQADAIQFLDQIQTLRVVGLHFLCPGKQRLFRI